MNADAQDTAVRAAQRALGSELAGDLRPLPGEHPDRVDAWGVGADTFVLLSRSGRLETRALPLADGTVLYEVEPEPGRLWGPAVTVEPGLPTVVRLAAPGDVAVPALLGAAGTVAPDGRITSARGVPGTTAEIEVIGAAATDAAPGRGVLVFEPDGIVTDLGPWTTTAGAHAHLPLLAGDADVVTAWTPGPRLAGLFGDRSVAVLVDVEPGLLAGLEVDGEAVPVTSDGRGVVLRLPLDEPERPRRIVLRARGLVAGDLRGVHVVDVPRRTTDAFRGPLDVRGSAWLEAAMTMPMGWESSAGVTIADVVSFHARPPGPPGASFEPAVVYGTAGATGRPLTLDLYRRTDPDERAPVVLFIHGGGWGGGDPWFHIRHAHAFAARGYVSAVVRYRLFQEALWPAALEDVTCAVRWVRATATQIGADPDRIAVAGGSAGGHLAALAALRPGAHEGTGGHADQRSDVQAAVLWYPAIDLTSIVANADLQPVLDTYFGAPREQAWREASPCTWVHGDAPPILTVTGSADQLTTLASIEAFHRRLDECGTANRLEVFADRDHAFDLNGGDDWHRSTEIAAAFLDEHLRHTPPATATPADVNQ